MENTLAHSPPLLAASCYGACLFWCHLSVQHYLIQPLRLPYYAINNNGNAIKTKSLIYLLQYNHKPQYRQAKAIAAVMYKSTDFGPITIRWLPAQQAMTSSSNLAIDTHYCQCSPVISWWFISGYRAKRRRTRVYPRKTSQRTIKFRANTTVRNIHWHTPLVCLTSLNI